MPVDIVTLFATIACGNITMSYNYTNEYIDSYIKLIYQRSRMYSPETGRFTTQDSWQGDYNRPLSLNRWMYVEGNPINYTDATGHWLCVLDLSGTGGWTGTGWTDKDIKKRVDIAEKYVSRTSDYMDTYVAAGIAVQCAGWNEKWNDYSGLGIAQITRKQAETESGKKITDIWERFRGYGLCPAEELNKPLDPMNTKDAVILMKREIQLVTNECKGCKNTDIYIAAGLAQNGPGFSYKEMQFLGELSSADQSKYLIKMNWFDRFKSDMEKNSGVNTRTQLNRFTLVIKELQGRGWYVPDNQIDFSWDTIEILRNWKVNQVNP